MTLRTTKLLFAAATTLFLGLAYTPTVSAGCNGDVYCDNVYDLDVLTVKLSYKGAVGTDICLTFQEEFSDVAGGEGANTTLCDNAQQAKLLDRNGVVKAIGVSGPIPVLQDAQDGAYVYFGIFKDTIPPSGEVLTPVSCFAVFQEGGDVVGVQAGDDFIIYTNCPQLEDAYYAEEA
jgi:hypothetical protein